MPLRWLDDAPSDSFCHPMRIYIIYRQIEVAKCERPVSNGGTPHDPSGRDSTATAKPPCLREGEVNLMPKPRDGIGAFRGAASLRAGKQIERSPMFATLPNEQAQLP